MSAVSSWYACHDNISGPTTDPEELPVSATVHQLLAVDFQAGGPGGDQSSPLACGLPSVPGGIFCCIAITGAGCAGTPDSPPGAVCAVFAEVSPARWLVGATLVFARADKSSIAPSL